MIGAQLKARGTEPTLRTLAEIMKVSPSTISRWFAENDLLDQVNLFAVGFDAEGNFDINRGVGPFRAK